MFARSRSSLLPLMYGSPAQTLPFARFQRRETTSKSSKRVNYLSMEDYKELIRSPEFHFLVGEERRKLTIHAALVKHLSPPLHALIGNGMMKESLSREAVLDDIEEETFIAFCEFGYRGFYSTPSIKDEKIMCSSFEAPTPAASSDSSKLSRFKKLELDGTLASSSSKPDFLAHAKVYVFADRYLIGSLKDQALKSLHRDLCNFDIKTQTTDQILELIQYCYDQTGKKSPFGSHSLRSIIIDYATCEIRSLVNNPRFRILLEEFGEIGADLVPNIIS